MSVFTGTGMRGCLPASGMYSHNNSYDSSQWENYLSLLDSSCLWDDSVKLLEDVIFREVLSCLRSGVPVIFF